MAFVETDNPRGIEKPQVMIRWSRQRREELQRVIAGENKCRPGDICIVCLHLITVAIFKGSGTCCDDHRKLDKADQILR